VGAGRTACSDAESSRTLRSPCSRRPSRNRRRSGGRSLEGHAAALELAGDEDVFRAGGDAPVVDGISIPQRGSFLADAVPPSRSVGMARPYFTIRLPKARHPCGRRLSFPKVNVLPEDFPLPALRGGDATRIFG